ncbi:MAG: acyl-CoA dehydrogenase family protein [Myxococcota bacterium]
MELEALVERAEKLVPEIAERALETERLRELPRANVDALVESGLTRALQPQAFGGSGLGALAHVTLTRTLAHGCVSTAWCQFVWSAHNRLLALYPERAQEEVWDDPKALIAASLGPVGQARRVDGGYRLSGRWTFASGCDAAGWLMLGASTEVDGAPAPILACVPKCEVEIVDTWHVSGLRGTGSKDVSAADVFVPEHRAASWISTVAEHQGFAVAVIAGPVLGGAEAAVGRFRQRLAGRVLVTMKKQQDMGSAKKRLAESAAEVEAARLLLERACGEIDACLAAGRLATPAETVRWIRDTAFCAELGTRATQRIFEASGGGALQESEPIQRIWRDVNAGHAHAFLNWDDAAEGWAGFDLDGGL